MKQFVSFETLRADAYKLAHRMYFQDNFVPDIIYTALRGGTILSNCISECFKLMLPKTHKPILYAGVVAHSYSDYSTDSTRNVRIDGWTYNPDWLRPGDKILLIDDLWDSGRTLTALGQTLLSKGIERSDLKICVHDYKLRSYQPQPLFVPDYYSNLIQIDKSENNPWIHYESHELVGLTINERRSLYQNDPELKKVIEDIFSVQED